MKHILYAIFFAIALLCAYYWYTETNKALNGLIHQMEIQNEKTVISF